MSKHLRAFRAGANILAYRKNNINYAMTCAWAMMVDYEQIAMLIGEQSVTGQNLEVGMLVGVSALASNQSKIAKVIGSNHSDSYDKLESISYINKNDMILINDAKVLMECEVNEIKDMNGDKLVFLKVNDFTEKEEAEFLDGYNSENY